MKQLKQIVMMLLMSALLILGLTPAVLADSQDPNQEIRIVHTNDTHGRYQDNAQQNGGVFGYDRLKTITAGSDKVPPADLVLDAGDTFHGLSFATVDKGLGVARLMNAAGYMATTPGNHDFNYGAAYLKDTLGTALNAEILSCNILDPKTREPYFKPYMIKEIPSESGSVIKVGILGITSPDIYRSTAPANVANLEFADPVIWAQKAVGELKNSGCTVIIALSHMGNAETLTWKSEMLAKQVGGIDLIIDGHTHVEDQRLVTRENGEQTLIVQTGAFFANAGMVTLNYDCEAQKITGLSTDQALLLNSCDENRPAQDSAVEALTETIIGEQAVILNQLAGMAKEALPYSWEGIRCSQQRLGQAVAEAYLKATGADVAFENAGGIRAGIDQGEMTRGEIINILPFGNYVITKEISAGTLLELIEDSLERGFKNQNAWNSGSEAWPPGSGAYLQWGGLKVVYLQNKPAGHRVVSVEIQGKPIDMDKTYKVATNQFVAEGRDYPKSFTETPVLNEYGSCEEILMAYVKSEDWMEALETPVFEMAGIAPSPTVKPENSQQPHPQFQPEQNQDGRRPQDFNPSTGQFARSALMMAAALLMVTGLIMVGLMIKGHKNSKDL